MTGSKQSHKTIQTKSGAYEPRTSMARVLPGAWAATTCIARLREGACRRGATAAGRGRAAERRDSDLDVGDCIAARYVICRGAAMEEKKAGLPETSARFSTIRGFLKPLSAAKTMHLIFKLYTDESLVP